MKKFVFLLFLFAVGCAVAPITGRKQLLVIPSSERLSLSADSYSS